MALRYRYTLLILIFFIPSFSFCQDTNRHTIYIQKSYVKEDSTAICVLFLKGLKLSKQQSVVTIDMDANAEIYTQIKRSDVAKVTKLDVIGCGDSTVVKSFTMNVSLNNKQSLADTYNGKGGAQDVNLTSSDEYLTDKMHYWINRLKKGSRIDFYNVICVNKYGYTKPVKSLSIIVD